MTRMQHSFPSFVLASLAAGFCINLTFVACNGAMPPVYADPAGGACQCPDASALEKRIAMLEAQVKGSGIHFEGSGVVSNIGINFDLARYNMGIDLADNSLRMNAGQKLLLERYGTIYLSYNANSGNIELVKGGRGVVAAW